MLFLNVCLTLIESRHARTKKEQTRLFRVRKGRLKSFIIQNAPFSVTQILTILEPMEWTTTQDQDRNTKCFLMERIPRQSSISDYRPLALWVIRRIDQRGDSNQTKIHSQLTIQFRFQR